MSKKKTLNATSVQIDSNFSEHVWAQIKLKNNDSLLIGCLYRSPSSSRDNCNSLINMLDHVNSLRKSHLLIMGDFNFKEIDWVNQSTSTSEEHISSLFLENIRDNYLFQHVTECTRYRENNVPSVVVLVFTNEENMISNMQLAL